MATPGRAIRRRTFRPTSAHSLVEGSLTRAGTSNYVTVDIAGGPPRVTATLIVGGVACGRVRLDGCGAGSVRVPAAPDNPVVEIAVENQVVLIGQFPAAPESRGPTTKVHYRSGPPRVDDECQPRW